MKYADVFTANAEEIKRKREMEWVRSKKQTRWTKWDLRFLQVAELLGSFSKDPSTQVGCVLADDRNRIIGTGFNGLPAGVKDTESRLQDRELRLMMTQHAERNALAFSNGDIAGCTAYIWPLPPCAPCAGALIQAGIARVVAPSLPPTHKRWEKDYTLSLEMYQEAGVIVDFETPAEPVMPENTEEKEGEVEKRPKGKGFIGRIRSWYML